MARKAPTRPFGRAPESSVPGVTHSGPVIIGYDGTPASEGALREAPARFAPRPALVVVVWEGGARLRGGDAARKSAGGPGRRPGRADRLRGGNGSTLSDLLRRSSCPILVCGAEPDDSH